MATLAPGAVDLEAVTEDVVDRLRHDAEFVALVAEKLGLTGRPELRTIEELIENDEDYAVEFKSTARWDLRENTPSKAMEDAVVKTIAGFLNADGGTLLIGIGPDRQVVGLEHDYNRVKPANGDGFANWLTTHLINAVGHTPVSRTRARIVRYQNVEVCRVDVAYSPSPVWAKTSKAGGVFFVRLNNSTRVVLRTRWTPTAWTTGVSCHLRDCVPPVQGTSDCVDTVSSGIQCTTFRAGWSGAPQESLPSPSTRACRYNQYALGASAALRPTTSRGQACRCSASRLPYVSGRGGPRRDVCPRSGAAAAD